MTATATTARRPAWPAADDRKPYAVWLGLIWFGLIAGFGLDVPGFLKQRPPAAAIVHVHAAVFTGWMVLLTAQVLLVLKGRIALHRRLGAAGLVMAILMIPLGLATALTVHAEYAKPTDSSAPFLAVNFADLLDFALLVGAGMMLRRDSAAHRRLMILATVALSDPGFARLSGYFIPDPAAFWPYWLHGFYGDFLVILAMGGWDLWRRRALHPAFVAGALLLVSSEAAACVMYFDPAWKAMTAQLVNSWPYKG